MLYELYEDGMESLEAGDIDRAEKCFKKGAANGCGACYYELGVICFNKGHLTEAIDHFESGANRGSADCMYRLALMQLTNPESELEAVYNAANLLVKAYALIKAELEGEIEGEEEEPEYGWN